MKRRVLGLLPLLLLTPALASVAGSTLSTAAVPTAAAAAPTPSVYEGFVSDHDYVRTPYGDIYVEFHRPVRGRMPVILQMTPYTYLYGRAQAAGVATSFYSDRYAQQGYATAFAHLLGTGESDGCWDYGGPAEAAAGAAVVEWLGTRSWSNGKVGMIGTSYDGAIQAAIATLAPEHLAAIVPQEPVTSWYDYNYDHAVTHNSTDDDVSPADTGYPVGTPDVFDLALSRTVNTDPERSPQAHAGNLGDRTSECEAVEHNMRGHVVNPSYAGFWRDRDWALRAGRVEAAVLLQHGWRDFNTKPNQFTRYWSRLGHRAADRRAIVGQWNHTDIFADGAQVGGLDAGEYLDAFFGRYLKGGSRAALDRFPKVLSQGSDGRWRRSLPLDTRPTVLRLGGESTFVNTGTQTSKAFKNLPPATDPDTATYISEPLAHATRIAGGGTVSVPVSVQSTRGQLDATLLDVAPDGTTRVVTLGLLDLRYAQALTTPHSLEPGEVQDVTITLRPQDAVVEAGHRLAVVLAGSETVWGVPDPVVGQVYTVGPVRLALPLTAP